MNLQRNTPHVSSLLRRKRKNTTLFTLENHRYNIPLLSKGVFGRRRLARSIHGRRRQNNGFGDTPKSPKASSVLGNVQGKCRTSEIGTERDGDGEKRKTRERRERRESGEREEVRRGSRVFVDTKLSSATTKLLPPREFCKKKEDKKVTFDDIFFSFLSNTQGTLERDCELRRR